MSEDDVIRMALEAGFSKERIAYNGEELARFGGAIRDAALEEAAAVCNRHAFNWNKSWHSGTEKAIAMAIFDCAAAIRAKKGER